MPAGELESLGEVGFALHARESTAGTHLDDHRAVEPGSGEVLEEFCRWLLAAARADTDAR